MSNTRRTNAKKSATTKSRVEWPENTPKQGIRPGLDAKPKALSTVPVDSKGQKFDPSLHRVCETTGAVILTPKGLCVSTRGRKSYSNIDTETQRLHKNLGHDKDFALFLRGLAQKEVAPSMDVVRKEATRRIAAIESISKAAAQKIAEEVRPRDLHKFRRHFLTSPSVVEACLANKAKAKSVGFTGLPTSKDREARVEAIEKIGSMVNYPEWVGCGSTGNVSAKRDIDVSSADLF